jgi:hypothetical protein
MSWWQRIWHGGDKVLSPLRSVRLTLQGWREEKTRGDLRVWRDSQGAVLSLAIPDRPFALSELTDETALREWCRSLAESQSAGLIDAGLATGALGAEVRLIYKRLQIPAYSFTGMLFLPDQQHVWTVVAGEHGTTGVREAVITAELMNSGTLTVEDYERSWARDPYDVDYHAVDRRVLRFRSDDECYDERFPEHPLSRARRVLAALPGSIQIERSNENP